MTRRKHSAAVALALAVSALAGCSDTGAANPAAASSGRLASAVFGPELDPAALPDARLDADMHGLQAPLPLEELADRVDAVVLASVGETSLHRFTTNSLIAEADKEELGYEESVYSRQSVTVDQVLHGQAPDELSVARMEQLVENPGEIAVVHGAELPRLSEGESYVLFVSKGSSIWAGHYLIAGPQGVGTLVDGQVTVGDQKLSLAELQQRLG